MLQDQGSPGASVRPNAGTACPLDSMFRNERAGLVRYLTKRVGPEIAHDLAQDVFVRAATSPQLSSLENPAAFLHRIAQNLLIDQARRRRCKIDTIVSDQWIESGYPAEQEYQIEADQLEKELTLALSGLPERTRKIFVMHRFESKAYSEIQHEFGITVAGVEYHMMKALLHIRACLRDRTADQKPNRPAISKI